MRYLGCGYFAHLGCGYFAHLARPTSRLLFDMLLLLGVVPIFSIVRLPPVELTLPIPRVSLMGLYGGCHQLPGWLRSGSRAIQVVGQPGNPNVLRPDCYEQEIPIAGTLAWGAADFGILWCPGVRLARPAGSWMVGHLGIRPVSPGGGHPPAGDGANCT